MQDVASVSFLQLADRETAASRRKGEAGRKGEEVEVVRQSEEPHVSEIVQQIEEKTGVVKKVVRQIEKAPIGFKKSSAKKPKLRKSLRIRRQICSGAASAKKPRVPKASNSQAKAAKVL